MASGHLLRRKITMPRRPSASTWNLHRRRAGALALAVALTGLAAGCGSSTGNSAAGKSTTTTTSARHATKGFQPPVMKYGTSIYGAPDPTTTIPTERGTRPINSLNDAGQQVVIAERGVLAPRILIAGVEYPITWTNLSGKPQQVVFNDVPAVSQIIAPGGTFSWKSPGYAINLIYHVVGGEQGTLILQD
jgi:hypothetical protein